MRLLISLVLLVVGFQTSIAQELVVNGGAESPLWMGWTQLNPVEQWNESAQRPPHSGLYHFYPGTTVLPSSELYQDINVSSNAASIDAGTGSYTFSGWRRGYNNVSPYSGDMDRSQIIVEYQDASGNVLTSYNTGSAVFNTWTNNTDTRNAPAGTRNIRIRLISVRVSGSDNDGYYDDISLIQTCNPPTSIVLTPGSAKSYCTGSAMTISAVVSPANANYYYTWYKDGDPASITSKTYTDITVSIVSSMYAGKYTLRVEDGNAGNAACYLEASVTITVDDLPVAGIIHSDQEICLGATANVLTGTASTGGVSTKNYKWQRSASAAGPWTTAQAYSTAAINYAPGAITSTTYYRRIDSSGSCPPVPTDTILIRVNNKPVLNPITSLLRDTLCAGENFQLTGHVNTAAQPSLNGGYYYSWRKTQGAASSVVSAPGPVLTTYPAIVQAASIADSGTYYLVVQDGLSATACKDSVKTIIRINHSPATKGIIKNSQQLCLTASAAVLTEVSPAVGYTGSPLYYQWYATKDTTGVPVLSKLLTGAKSSTYNPGALTSTSYFVRKDSVKYCAAVATNFLKIQVNNKPVLKSIQPIVNDTLCENLGDQFQLKAAIDSITSGKASLNGGYYFTWKKLQAPSTTTVPVSTTGKYSDYPATSRAVTEADSGTYYLVVQDGKTATTCLDSILIKITVIKTCLTGCAKPDAVSIKVAATSSAHVCPGNALTLQKDVITFPVSPPTYGYTYSWIRTNTLGTIVVKPASATYQDLTVSSATLADSGRYQLIVQDGSANPASCAERSAPLSIIVDTISHPHVSISSGLTCQSTNLLLTATASNAGSTPAYTWQESASVNGPWSVISGATTSTYLVTAPQAADSGTVYKVIVASSELCNAGPKDTIVILQVQHSIQPKVSVSSNPAGVLCDTLQSVTYTAKPIQGNGTITSYQWYNGKTGNSIPGANAIQYTPAAKPAKGDSVYVIMTTNLSCASTATATSAVYALSVIPKPDPLIATTDTSICIPGSVSVNTKNTASSGSVFQWFKNGTPLPGATGKSYTVSSTVPGTDVYMFEESNNACASVSTNKITVTGITPPVVSAGADFSASKNTTVTLQGNVSNGADFIWKPATGLSDPHMLNPTTVISTTVSYTLFATDATGLCPAENTVTITVESAVKIPNVLTPNGDGLNDNWNIEHLQDYPFAVCTVYNRWGNIVWKNSNNTTLWNGTNYRNGDPLPEGTYFYIIDLKSPAYSEPYTGYVEIVR